MAVVLRVIEGAVRWTSTIVAAIEHPDHLELATERFEMEYSPLRTEGGELEAAKNVLLDTFRRTHERKVAATEQEDRAFLQEAETRSKAGVGHTYVTLSAKAGDTLPAPPATRCGTTPARGSPRRSRGAAGPRRGGAAVPQGRPAPAARAGSHG